MGTVVFLLVVAVLGVQLIRYRSQLTDFRQRYRPLIDRQDSLTKLETQLKDRRHELESLTTDAHKREKAIKAHLGELEVKLQKYKFVANSLDQENLLKT